MNLIMKLFLSCVDTSLVVIRIDDQVMFRIKDGWCHALTSWAFSLRFLQMEYPCQVQHSVWGIGAAGSQKEAGLTTRIQMGFSEAHLGRNQVYVVASALPPSSRTYNDMESLTALLLASMGFFF